MIKFWNVTNISTNVICMYFETEQGAKKYIEDFSKIRNRMYGPVDHLKVIPITAYTSEKEWLNN